MLCSEQKSICDMFDSIAKTYDQANRILSFGQDVRWRKTFCNLMPKASDILVLDVATGTADLLIAMCSRNRNIKQAVGVDISESMLLIARNKIKQLNLENRISLDSADACFLPFASNHFDVVSIAFGIRNVINFKLALKEIARVLKPEGTALILEFSMPKKKIIRLIYLFYFRYILPFLGGLISRQKKAYSYLNRSVEAFPCGSEFIKIMKDCGFKTVLTKELTFGIATIYCARKS